MEPTLRDGLGAILFGAAVSGTAEPVSVLSTKVIGTDWLTGGAHGYEASALAGPLELLTLAGAVLAAKRLPTHPDVRQHFRGWQAGLVDRERRTHWHCVAPPKPPG